MWIIKLLFVILWNELMHIFLVTTFSFNQILISYVWIFITTILKLNDTLKNKICWYTQFLILLSYFFQVYKNIFTKIKTLFPNDNIMGCKKYQKKKILRFSRILKYTWKFKFFKKLEISVIFFNYVCLQYAFHFIVSCLNILNIFVFYFYFLC